MKEHRKKTATITDKRIRLINEIISGIKVIKMYTWEIPFGKLIEYMRKYLPIIKFYQTINTNIYIILGWKFDI